MTRGLHIQPMEKKDLEFIHKLRTNPDMMDYWFEEPYMTKEHLEDIYDERLKSHDHRLFILHHYNERVGFLGILRMDPRHQHAEFAIMIAPEHQGKGYATNSTRLLINYAFMQLPLHKLYLYVDKENEKAAHIYEKIGFQKEGELREHYFVQGKYHNVIVMSLLRDEYVELSD